MLKKMSVAVMAIALLTACTPAEEESPAQNAPQPSARAFNENPDEDTSQQKDDGTSDENNEDSGFTSDPGSAPQKRVDFVKDFLKEAGDHTIQSKGDNGYTEEPAYQPPRSFTLRMIPTASSKESFCLAAGALEFPDLVFLYDSQQKKVLPEGSSCKGVIGEPWMEF